MCSGTTVENKECQITLKTIYCVALHCLLTITLFYFSLHHFWEQFKYSLPSSLMAVTLLFYYTNVVWGNKRDTHNH